MISRAGQRMCLEELPHQHSRINSMRGGTQDRYAYIDHKRVSSAMKLKDGNRPTAATATGDWIEGTGNRGKLCLSVHPWGDRKTVRVAPEGCYQQSTRENSRNLQGECALF